MTIIVVKDDLIAAHEEYDAIKGPFPKRPPSVEAIAGRFFAEYSVDLGSALAGYTRAGSKQQPFGDDFNEYDPDALKAAVALMIKRLTGGANWFQFNIAGSAGRYSPDHARKALLKRPPE